MGCVRTADSPDTGSDYQKCRTVCKGILRFFTSTVIMGKKIIALLGSPLSDGNTAKLLDRAIKGAEDAG